MAAATLCHRVVLAAAISWSAAAAPPTAGLADLTAWSDVHFTNRAPYTAQAEMMRHLGHRLPVSEYDLKEERYRVFVPDTYTTNGAWGLLVWVSPGDDPRIPQSWENELAEQQLLCVSAYGAGNDRHAIERCRLALDAVCNMSRGYKLDANRLYIGGFSGGGRIASIMGVAYADLFTGAIAMCGADFYTGVRSAGGAIYPATYQPNPGVLARAKSIGAFVLITGEQDANRDNTRTVAEQGFKRQGFRHCLYLEVAGMGHSHPAAQTLRQALQFLRSAASGSRNAGAPSPTRAD